MAPRTKVFRYAPPKPKQLAKIVYDRCTKNVERYQRAHKDAKVFVGSLQEATSRGTIEFYLSGRTSQDEEKWKAEYLRNFERKNGYPGHALLNAIKNYSSGTGVLTATSDGYATQRGWELDVVMYVDAPTQFDVKVGQSGEAPPEILRCLRSTYNALVEEHGLRDES